MAVPKTRIAARLPPWNPAHGTRFYNKLLEFIIANNILYEKQFGFRQGHATSHAFMILVEKVTKARSLLAEMSRIRKQRIRIRIGITSFCQNPHPNPNPLKFAMDSNPSAKVNSKQTNK